MNEWTEVGPLTDIEPLGSRVASSSQGDIAIFRTEGDEVFALDVATDELVDVSHQWRDALRRTGHDKAGANKEPVPTTAFLDPDYARISGVLYDSACVTNFRPPEYARWTYVHNVMAPVRLPPEGLLCETEYWSDADGDELIVRWREPDPEPA